MDQLRIRLLGGLEVDGISAHDLGSRKARTLVKRLALARGAAVSPDQAIDALWGDDLPARPGDQLGVLVSRLRGSLGAERLVRSDAGYRLVVDWLDVDELAARVEEAATLLGAGNLAPARAMAGAALALVRGELLSDEPDAAWADADRAALAPLVARARRLGAEAELAAGDPDGATVLASVALEADPYDEAALRVLMQAHHRAGRPGTALAAYTRTRARLAEDLGIGPASETEALHDAIVLGEPAGPPPAAPPLPGRDAERTAIASGLARCRVAGPTFVLVDGEPGIGTTRLLDVAAADLRAAGAVVLTAACGAAGRGLPLQPVLDALARHLRGCPPEEAAALLGPDRAIVEPLIDRVDPTGRADPSLVAGPASHQATVLAALRASIVRAGAGRPVALVIDGLGAADPVTVAWVRLAMDEVDAPLLLLGSPGHDGRESGWPDPWLRLTVGPLDRAAAAEMVGTERVDTLLERSGGNPRFLAELAAAPAGAGEDLPASLVEAVSHRVRRLAPDSTSVLAAAAVIGPAIDLDLLADVLQRPVLDLVDHLEEAARAGLLSEDGLGFAFRHPVVADALRAPVTGPRRSALHRAAAEALARRAGPDHLAVAHHARVGGAPAVAASALVAAAEAALHRGAAATAERMLDEALDLDDSAAGRLARGRVRVALGRLAEADDDAREALALGGGAAALELAGWSAYYQRDLPTARAHAEAAAREADPDLEADVRTGALLLAGRTCHVDGDLEAADRRLLGATATATGPVAPMADVWTAGLRVHQGRPQEAVELARRGLLAAPRFPTPVAELHGLMALAHGLGQQGQAAAALDALARFDDVRREWPELSARFAGRSENFQAWILGQLEAREEARALSRRALSETEAPGFGEARTHALLDLADAAIAEDDLERAGAILTEVREAIDAPWSVMRWHQLERQALVTARWAVAAHDATAPAAARSAADLAGERGNRRSIVLAGLVVALADATVGTPVDRDHVDGLLREADSIAGLEVWRLTSDLAEATDDGRWAAEAAVRVDRLAAAAGPRGPAFRAAATAHLDR